MKLGGIADPFGCGSGNQNALKIQKPVGWERVQISRVLCLRLSRSNQLHKYRIEDSVVFLRRKEFGGHNKLNM